MNINQKRPTVFVTQELPALDYSSAERYGDVKFLTHREMSSARNSIANDALTADITNKLRDFNPDTDFIVFSGSPAIVGLVFLTLGAMGVKKVRFLRWSNRDMVYNLIEIEVKL